MLDTLRAPLGTLSGLIVVHVDALELEIGVTVVRAGGVDTVLVGDDLPELGTDLVAALACLAVDDLAHGVCRCAVAGIPVNAFVLLLGELRLFECFTVETVRPAFSTSNRL